MSYLRPAVFAAALVILIAVADRAQAGSGDYEPGGRYDYSAPSYSGRQEESKSVPGYSSVPYERSNIERQQYQQDQSRYGDQSRPYGKDEYRPDYRHSNAQQRQFETDQRRYGNY